MSDGVVLVQYVQQNDGILQQSPSVCNADLREDLHELRCDWEVRIFLDKSDK
jgi:hypothetical protein